MSMVAYNILVRISSALTAAKKAAGVEDGDSPFRGINMILVGISTSLHLLGVARCTGGWITIR